MTDYRYQHLIRQDCPLPPGTHVVAYCRDSGGDEQDRSVGQQKAAIVEYCDKHQLILERFYADEARTGSDSERRSQLNEMRADLAQRFVQIRNLNKRNKHIKTHPFGLLTWKSNRLGRDNLDITFNKADLRLRGITIISMVAAIETGDAAMNAMFESMQQVQDERLLQEQSENTRRGLSDVVTLRDNDPDFRAVNPDWPTNDGRYLGIKPGVVPKGFRAERVLIDMRDRKSARRGGEKHHVQRIVPDHENNLWERCSLAWQMRHEGQPIKKIMQATRLYKNAGGYDHFFENQIYTGTLIYGGNELKNFVEPLIPEDWWHEEQKRRAERHKKHQGLTSAPEYEPRRVASRHLLSGLVFCGAIDGEEHPTTADTIPAREGKRTRWDFYICTLKKNSRDHRCTSARIGAAALDRAVIDALLRDAITVENLRPIAKAAAALVGERNRDVKERIKVVEGQLAEVQKSLNQLMDAIEKSGFSTSIQARLKEREAEERKLIADLVMLQDLLVKPADVPKVGEAQLKEWIEDIRLALTSDDLELARAALRQFVRKIVVNGKAGTIYYTFPLSDLSRLREVVLTDTPTSPRYHTCKFRIRPISPQARLPETPEHAALREQVERMRADSMSYPLIARTLNISVGAAWKLAQDRSS